MSSAAGSPGRGALIYSEKVSASHVRSRCQAVRCGRLMTADARASTNIGAAGEVICTWTW